MRPGISSRRSRSGGIAINCGAIPADLIESELFGYARGAFTGALTNKTGPIESADGGTLFLDEVGELPLGAQVKLLRVLQEGEIAKLGESTPVRVDVRIIAATHRDLSAMVEDATFREDLYYRLAVVPDKRAIAVPIVVMDGACNELFAQVRGCGYGEAGFSPK
jgi:two-component system, NtrC family, response regulator AtoC